MRHLIGFVLAVWLTTGSVHAAFEFSAFNTTGGGAFSVSQGPSQAVDIFITNSNPADQLGSVGLRVQIGDGQAGAGIEPQMVSVTTSGAGYLQTTLSLTSGGVTFSNGASGSEMLVDLTNLNAPVSFTGTHKLATIFLDTSAFGGQGPFDLLFTNSAGSSFVNDPSAAPHSVTLSNGSFTVTAVPEPSSLVLAGLCMAAAGFRRRRR